MEKQDKPSNNSNSYIFITFLSPFLWVLWFLVLKNLCHTTKKPTFNKPIVNQRVYSPLDNKCFATISPSLSTFLPSFSTLSQKSSHLAYSSSQAMGRQLKTSIHFSSQSISTKNQLEVFAKQNSTDSPKIHPLAPSRVHLKGKHNGHQTLSVGGPMMDNQIEGEIAMTFDMLEKTQIWRIQKEQAREDQKQERKEARKNAKAKRKKRLDDIKFLREEVALRREQVALAKEEEELRAIRLKNNLPQQQQENKENNN